MTVPEVPTVATEASLLLHVPPDGVAIRDTTDEIHNVAEPTIVGVVFIVITVVVNVPPGSK